MFWSSGEQVKCGVWSRWCRVYGYVSSQGFRRKGETVMRRGNKKKKLVICRPKLLCYNY